MSDDDLNMAKDALDNLRDLAKGMGHDISAAFSDPVYRGAAEKYLSERIETRFYEGKQQALKEIGRGLAAVRGI
jgi:hypothetical protein